MAPWRIQPSETFLKRLRRCKADKASSGTAAGSSRICPPRTIPHPWAFRKKVRMGLSWHACCKIRCPCLQRRLRPPQDRSDKDWGPQDGARKRWMRPPRGRKSLIRSVQNRGVDAAPRPQAVAKNLCPAPARRVAAPCPPCTWVRAGPHGELAEQRNGGRRLAPRLPGPTPIAGGKRGPPRMVDVCGAGIAAGI